MNSLKKAISCRLQVAGLLVLFSVATAWAEPNLFTGHDAEKLVMEAIIAKEAKSEVTVALQNMREEDILFRSTLPLSGSIDNLVIDEPTGHWQALLLPKEAERNLPPVRLTGTFDTMVEIPVLKRQVKSGEIIYQEDVEMVKQPARRLRKNTITEVTDIIGKSPKRVITASRAIRSEEIASPIVIKRGAHVTLFFKTPNIEIKTMGEAMENGAQGDVIRIRNLASKQVIDGKVESSDLVRVSSPDSQQALVGR